MSESSKLLPPKETLHHIGFISNNQQTQKDTQHQKIHPQTGLSKVSPPLQQDNEHSSTQVQQPKDPNLNISNIDLCESFYSIKLN